MKFAAAMSFLAVSQTQAQATGNVTHPDGRKFSHIVNMAYTQIDTSHSSKDISKIKFSKQTRTVYLKQQLLK